MRVHVSSLLPDRSVRAPDIVKTSAAAPSRTQSGTPIPPYAFPASASPGIAATRPLNPLHPRRMPDPVLRHRPLPLENPRQQRLGANPQDFAQLLSLPQPESHRPSALQDFFIPSAAEKTPDQRPIIRRAVREIYCAETSLRESGDFPSRGTRNPNPAGSAARTLLSKPKITVTEELYRIAFNSAREFSVGVRDEFAAA